MQLKVDVNRAGLERVRQATDLLVITRGELQGPVLTRVAQQHRKQEARIFASEGAEGASGAWPRLSADYAETKRRAAGAGRREVKGTKGKARTAALRARKRPISQKILVWSGEMRDRFLRHGHPANVEEFVQTSATTGKFRLGAQSEIAGYHFGGTARMPARDMVRKTHAQVQAIWQVIVDWYRTEKLPQAQRALAHFQRRQGPLSGGGASGRAAAPSPAP